MAHDPVALLLTNARKSSRLTQLQVAERAGTTQSAIARYEKGTLSPSMDTLQRLLKANGFELILDTKRSKVMAKRSPLAKKIQANRGKIKKILTDAGATNIRIFGSVARGTDNKRSDVDFLVDVDKESEKTIKVMLVAGKLERILGCKVDVIVSRLCKKEILKSALSDAIPL